MTLLPVSHRRQQQQADCLAACAAMALDYLLDPDTAVAPQAVSLAEFELAWLGKDYLYAVIETTP